MSFRIAFTFFLAGVTACSVGVDDDTVETEDSDVTFCRPAPVDQNGDGTPEGLDINCDGVLDIDFGGGGSGNQNKCTSVASTNGQTKAITCTSNGGSATCECRVNGALASTCSQPAATCSIGTPGANCCGY